MRTLIANELDLVHGGANDGRWHWVDIGHNGQALGVEPPATVGYRTPNILLGAYGYNAIVSHNFVTGGNNVSITATDGGQQFNFNFGSSGGEISFTDSFNDNAFQGVIDITPSGDIGMLELQFTHKFNVEPRGVSGGALAAVQPSLR